MAAAKPMICAGPMARCQWRCRGTEGFLGLQGSQGQGLDTSCRETLRHLGLPTPQVTDDVERWLPMRTARAIKAHGLRTLADLTVRIPRRRRWWTAILRLGATGARQAEAFFAAHPQLTERARALVPIGAQQDFVPWEKVCVPSEIDGSKGTFRAPKATSTLDASNDYEAAQDWLSLHESIATQRAYQKEAELLILWAVVERGRAIVFTNDRGRRGLSCVPSASGTMGNVDRSIALTRVARMAPLHRWTLGALGGLRLVGDRCNVPLADPAALCRGQPVCGHQGARRLTCGASCGHPRLRRG